jgi:hypothetical protein
MSLLAGTGFEPVEVAYVATLHCYAARWRPLDGVLRTSERVLPERMRSTIVGWFRAR